MLASVELGWSFSLALGSGLVLTLGWDQTVAAWVLIWRDEPLVVAWGVAAYWLGLGWVQAVPVLILAAWGKFKGRRDLTRTGMTGAVAVLLAGVTVQVSKHLVGRPRPRLELPVWESFGPTLQSDLHSFPSGHASTSFAIAAVLAGVWPRAAWIFYIIAAFVCVGRVLSSSHHLSDVLAGALLGLLAGWLLSGRFFLPGKEGSA
jgi:membrane-associated phospholipid phosphatase